MAKQKRIGLIGCGAIGTLIASACRNKLMICDEIIVYDFDPKASERLAASTDFPLKIAQSFDELLELKPSIIVEAASQQAALEYVPKIVDKGIDVVVMSTGAMLQHPPQSNLIHMPSGAIGGLDALAAAALAGIDEIALTTRKNPRALKMNNNKAQLVYEGTAEDAASRFPREMNVAATLALTVKPLIVKVQVISDPLVNRNTHEIRVNWRYGEMYFKFSNDPHPENPKTSALAAWSAIRLLQKFFEA